MRRSIFAVAIVVVALVASAAADTYMHNPRGSNDRLNEKNTNRQNANRLWDSQNNAKGGYSVGPQKMYFYVGSKLNIQWTNQHGCGMSNEKNGAKTDCQFVIQYMCDEHVGETMRDGTTTNTVPDDANDQKDPKFGRMETYEYYQHCKTRERNKGLFIADRNVGNSARSTRQNNGGTRHGFECPEERDYYPYWHWAPWVDVAVLTNNMTMCEWYQAESQNVKDRGECSNKKANNPAACEQEGAEWVTKPSWNITAPECLENEPTYVNHLGMNMNGKLSSYEWTIPDTPSKNCVLRLRYNITTGDYDGFHGGVDSTMNKKASPIKQDPLPDHGGKNVSLALNTNQYGRTFQDRSYLFEIRARPDDIPVDAVIHNLNVRGKRGNIVQTYPAVEYDFVPNRLEVTEGEYVHFQWSGSDYNANNGNNNAEGTDGTDRNNLVQIEKLTANQPMKFENHTLFENEETAKRFAHLDQTDCLTYAELMEKHNNNKNDIEEDPKNCAKLNAASAYFDGGLMKMNNTGEFYYMSTRNNNFSNRSQKGTLVVKPLIPVWGQAVAGVAAGLVAIGAASAVAWKKGLFASGSAAASSV